MINKVVRSPLFYVGDKYKLMKQLLDLFPKEIDNFYEPFVGGGSVFLNVKARKYYLNDIDRHLINFHRFLIEYSKKPNEFFALIEKIIYKNGLSRSYKEDIIPFDLKKVWKKTYYARFNKENYNKLKHDFNNSVNTDMFQFYVLLIYSFNRMIRFNSLGKYNVPVGNVDFNNNVVVALNNYFDLVKSREIELTNLDYQEFLGNVNFKKNDFVYFDPPYLLTFSEYNKLWNEDSEVNLLKYLTALNSIGVKFAVSNVIIYKNKENAIFKRWSKNYNVFPIKSNYISYHDNSKKEFEEILVTNYDINK